MCAVVDSTPVADYKIEGRRVVFSDEAKIAHRNSKTPLWEYLRHSRLLVALSAPLIYLCLVPFLLLDLLIFVYQVICFPIYGIPKVQRADCFIFDRGKLLYLNALERLNCVYCSYANGLIRYVAEIVGRTEQHWCPIKHAHHVVTKHSRYERFLPYGDAEAYRKQMEEVRRSFRDLTP
jgi:hypothetical protein